MIWAGRAGLSIRRPSSPGRGAIAARARDRISSLAGESGKMRQRISYASMRTMRTMRTAQRSVLSALIAAAHRVQWAGPSLSFGVCNRESSCVVVLQWFRVQQHSSLVWSPYSPLTPRIAQRDG
jgi:hypothetical protein